MDLSPLFPPSLSLFSSPSEISLYKHYNRTHLPLVHTNSFHLGFNFHGGHCTPIATVVAAAVKQPPTNEVEREVPAGNNQNQYTQLNTQKSKGSNVLLWNDMIRDYLKNGFCEEALKLYYQMQRTGIEPDKLVFTSVINACGRLSALQAGRKIHEDIIARGFESDVFVGTALATMYIKCRNLENALRVFDRMAERDVVSWNAMIAGFSQNGHPRDSLAFFNEMQVEGIKANSFTMVSVLHVCAALLALEQGKQIHGYVIRSGFESDVVVGNALVDMYAKCGNVDIACKLFEIMPQRNVVSWNAIIDGYTKCGHVEIAHKLFERMPQRNVVSWTAIITGYSQNGQPLQSLALFNEMQIHGIKPNSFTMVSVLHVCSELLALEQGKQIHSYVIRSGFESDVVVNNALVDMYAKCGNIDIAYKLFERMPQRNIVSWTTIIDGYAKCGNVNNAHRLFERMPEQNVVSWTAIIAGYSQNGHPYEALSFFNEMQVQGIKPNSFTMVSVLAACTDLLALEQGKQIHGYVIRSGFQHNVFVGNGLVDVYAKCGHIGIAQQVFDKMSSRNVASWNTMIMGYGIHGHGQVALALFSQMQQSGTQPDHITFIGVLTACSHAGLIDEGWQYFECMKVDYGLAPKLQHYACLVDLLGRARRLDEAHDIIKKMPLTPDAVIWGSLLGACRIHCNIELGEQAAKQLFELEPSNAGSYVLLSNIYAEAGRWEDVAKLRTMMKEREVKKQQGCSFIEVNREVHKFFMEDRTHPQSEKIYAMLENLYGQMKEAGYVPDINLVLQDVDEEVKENMLCSHSEKLAIAFGIINTSPGISIRITKSLRVCSDCHNATKFISKIVRRDIIARDSNRFHHFKDGVCSCGDYW